MVFRLRVSWIGLAALLATAAAGQEIAPRWSAERAAEWYAQQPWLVGANFVPSTANNQLEMWQAETFDPETIDRELGWASDAGYNCMRVFLHDMVWSADPDGFFDRVDQYLDIADKHGIKTMFVLFDSVWNPQPKLGPQPEPRPYIHNSRWVQSPHIDVLADPARHAEVKPFVDQVLTRYKNDPRVLCWDLYNEPGNRSQAYPDADPENKVALSTAFLKEVIAWARAVDPSQPLTIGVWESVGTRIHPVIPIDQLMLDNSDIITFHTYSPFRGVQRAVTWLEGFGRPMICTEYMARSMRNTIPEVLPYFKEQNVGAINWGLVSGRSQTIYPWSSWIRTVEGEPDPWFHDIFHKDGTPYNPAETKLIHKLTGRP